MWQTLEKNDVIRRLNTKEREGLTEEEVKIRQAKYGKNKLKDKKKESIIIKFIKQFNDFMIITLIIASIISAVISKMQGENDYVDSIIIIGIVIFNALMGVIQEAKAEKSIEALKQMTPQITKVIRNGKTTEINAEDLVKGDIVILETGNFIPADCRIIESHNLKIEESSLTGEAEPSLKEANIICKKDIPLGDMKNMAFMASTVVNGTGKAIVTETGMETKVGQIANMIIEDEAPETPLQKKLGEVGKILGIACLAICIIIFIIGLIKKIEPIEMFMTAVGLAVAAIPEGLPAIVTIMLSIGVTKMAKRNSIIRKLPAVETLGSSNVICSDKTGTLTQNKMKVVEVKSKNPKFIITMATLCTDCEITVENNQEKVIGEPTEKAIVEEGLHIGCNKKETEKIFPRINEIPFDSNRKMMTTIHRIGNKYRIICKGAPDVLLDKCTKEVLEIVDSQDIKVKTLDKLKIKIPKFGKLLMTIYTSRFARTLCSLYTSGMSIVNALNIAKTTIGNVYIESQFDGAIKKLRNGESLSQAIKDIDGFDIKLTSSIFVGEESGRLESMLTTLADDFDFEAEQASERMITLIQPLMIIFLAVVICLIIISVLLPIYTLYNNVGNM